MTTPPSSSAESDGPVTLDMVARLSGVSAATASRVMNARPGVRDDVRDRVLRIADSLGYVPNRAAKHLASGRSALIGLVVPSSGLRTDPYAAALVDAVGRAADHFDHGLILHLSHDQPTPSVRQIVRDRLVDGLIISAGAASTPWVEDLLAGGLPIVMIGRSAARDDVVKVDVESMRSSQRAVAHLVEQGCRRIATVTGPLDRPDAMDRFAGYRAALEAAGLPYDEDLVAHGDFSLASGGRVLPRLLAVGADAIVAANDLMARGVMRAMSDLGKRAPNDVAVVGFDGAGGFEDIDGEGEDVFLSTVRQPFALVGRQAMELLLALIAGDRRPDVVLDPELVVGQSSRRSTAAGSGPMHRP